MDYSIGTAESILIGRFLTLTAQKLNVVWAPDTQPGDICRNPVLAAQAGGKLDPGAYRLLWELWGALR